MLFDAPWIEETFPKKNDENHFKGHSIRKGGPLVKFLLEA